MPPEPTAGLAAAAAALLAQGKVVDGVSRLLTAGSLIGLVAFPGMSRLATATFVAAALLGLAETYFAVRVGLDAALFRRLAKVPDLAGFDAAMLRLGLLSQAKAGRPVEARVAGARRLFTRQAAALALQSAVLIGGGLAGARG